MIQEIQTNNFELYRHSIENTNMNFSNGYNVYRQLNDKILFSPISITNTAKIEVYNNTGTYIQDVTITVGSGTLF